MSLKIYLYVGEPYLCICMHSTYKNIHLQVIHLVQSFLYALDFLNCKILNRWILFRLLFQISFHYLRFVVLYIVSQNYWIL